MMTGTSCGLLFLAVVTTTCLGAQSQTTSTAVLFRDSSNVTVLGLQKSCPITKRFSDDFASCTHTWTAQRKGEERAGEGSTCTTNEGQGLQKFKCVDGKWTRVAVAHHRQKRVSGCPSDIHVTADSGKTCAVVTWNRPSGKIDKHSGPNPGDCLSAGSHRVKYEDTGWWITNWWGSSCSFTIYVKLRCRQLSSLSNGGWSCSGGSSDNHGEGSTCRFSCNLGFRLDGSSSTTCRQSGSVMEWSSSVPYCRGKCQALPAITNGARSCTDTIYESSACTHTCDGGYRLSGSSVTRCLKSGTSTYRWDNTSPTCLELCAWQTSHCWPGDCSNQLASNCRCRTGFKKVIIGGRQRCEMNTQPNLSTCRVSVTDSQGNIKNSSTSGRSTKCDYQQDEWISTQPTELHFAIKADLNMDIGTRPQYISDSKAGIVGAVIRIVQVAVTGTESSVKTVALNSTPYCQRSVSSTQPIIGHDHHDCEGTIRLPSVNLRDGERLCADMEAQSGGFYQLRDGTNRLLTFTPVRKSKRVCFLYDGTAPAHCSSSGPPCTSQPLRLSTRLTRQPGVRAHVTGWLDPYPANGRQDDVSQIAKYILEIHEVERRGSSLVVQDSHIRGLSENWTATPSAPGDPYDVDLNLPAQSDPRLYAVLMEVHDHAGNVGYARRLLLFDNSSTVQLNDSAVLRAISADPRANFEWQTNVRTDLCVSWKDRFYNSEMIHTNWLLPVASDTARHISGHYDQIEGLLPVQGTDNVKGVVKFEMSWKRDQEPPLPFAEIRSVQAQSSCLNERLSDGQTYHVTIRASDIMGNTKEDSVTVSIDHTSPIVDIKGLRGRSGRNGLYVHNTTDLSAMKLLMHASDPHSGLKTLNWTLGTTKGTSDIGSGAWPVQRVNETRCTQEENCYCPSVGECELYAYIISFNTLSHSASQGQHHREYYLTVDVTNGAKLPSSDQLDILIDESPPTSGVVLEGPGSDDQAEMDFTSSDRVHVHWHGFQDHESGVLLYRVALADHCLTSAEMETFSNVTEVEQGESVTLRFPQEGHFITTVVAYNGAMEPSKPGCSDGITYDTTPPLLLNVSLTHARTGHAISCTAHGRAWLINRNLTRTRLSQTDGCVKFCAKYETVQVEYLPVALNESLEEDVSTDLCSRLPAAKEASASFAAGERTHFIVLPSDFLRLSWVGYDEESQMEEYHVGIGTDSTTADAPDLLAFTPTHGHSSYHVRHSGLGHGDLFYIFVRAVSKAGLEAKVTLGPVIIDVTPPEVTQSLMAVVEGNDLVVTWAERTFADPEQPDSVEFDVTYRVGFIEHFVTPFLTMPQSALAQCKNSTVSGCVRYPINALQPYDTQSGRLFFFQLHVINAAGHIATVNTSSARLPPHSPPSHATVKDVIPLARTKKSVAPKAAVTSDPVAESMTSKARAENMTSESKVENMTSDSTPEDMTSSPISATQAFDAESTTAFSDIATLEPSFPPEYSDDVDVTMERTEICIAWHSDFYTNDVTVEVGIGTTPEKDDFIPFFRVTDKRSPVCVDASYDRAKLVNTYTRKIFPVYTKLYSLVRTTNKAGSTVASSDGFTTIPRDDKNNKLLVFNGRGCGKVDQIGETKIGESSSVMFDLPTKVALHTGDMLFVKFTPFLPDVLFKNALWVTRSHQGYQIILKSPSVRVVVSTEEVIDTNVEVFHCVKDEMFLPMSVDHVTVTWEISGPWTSLVKKLKVEVTDETCLETASKKEKYKDLECLVGEKRVHSSSEKVYIHGEPLFPGHSYTSSVSACFDDGCFLAAKSGRITVEDSERSVEFDTAVIHYQSSDSLEAEFNASIAPPLALSADTPCVFQWTVSRDDKGLTPLADWRVVETTNCSSMQIRDVLTVERNKGTLYACVQSLFPWRSGYPTCHRFTHLSPNQHAEPYNVIELSLPVFENTDFDRYLKSRHLGSNFRDLLDLDLDYAESDVILAAIVTGGGEREVQWFLMKDKQSVPVDGDCAGDPHCQFTRTTNNGKVIFLADTVLIQDGQLYYICAIVAPPRPGVLQGGQEAGVEVCGDGVVTDNRPPATGSVSIHSGHTGHLANSGNILVTWSGFDDLEDTLPRLKNGNTLNYSVALGSYPGAQDIAQIVSVGQRTTWTFTELNITSGTTCVATVKAEDRVGHVTEAYSQQVVIDSTPPGVGVLMVGAISQRRFVSSRDLNIQWEDVEDLESGIASIEVAIITKTGQEAIPFQTCEDNAILIQNATQLVDGHIYIALLKVTNRAGLTTLAHSEPFIADSSPPGLGKVFNSASNTSDHTTYSTELGTYSIYWSGFSDPHSGLDYYRVGLGTQPGHTDIESFVYVGRQTSFTWRHSLDQGKKYYSTVEACNRAGLFRRASTGSITFDNSPPLAGSVTVGPDGRHSRFLGHNSSLPVQWTGFHDPQTGIHDFSWCVGTASGACDVIPSTYTLLSRAAVKAGLSLPVNTLLFVSVTARNPLGMTAVGVSDSFIVDPTPPVVVTEPYFVSPQDGGRASSQWDRSVVRLVWGFRDPDSAVDSYTVSIRSQRTGRLVMDPVTVIAENGITLTLDEEHLVTDGDRHWAAVTACNAAHLCTTRTSGLLLIDSTPPALGTPRSPLAWFRNTSATFVNVSWHGFIDAESDVVKYVLTVGKRYNGDELSGQIEINHNGNVRTQSTTVQLNDRLTSGENIFVSIWAENGAGLRSPISHVEFEVLFEGAAGTLGTLVAVRHSCQAAYCTGECACTAAGKLCQRSACQHFDPSDPAVEGLSVVSYIGPSLKPQQFTTSTKCLEGHWRLSDSRFQSQVLRYEVSFGLASSPADESLEFSAEHNAVWHDVAHSTEAILCLPGRNLVDTGSQFHYVMRVRIWLSRDRSVTFTSDPVTVDHTAPVIRRGGVVIESTDGCSSDANFLTTEREFTACWGNVFRERESRITRYEVWVGTTLQADDIIQSTNVGLNTTFKVSTAGFEEGIRYYVTVRAVNSVDLMTSGTSDGITIDVTAPVAGVVFTSDGHTNRLAQWSSTSLTLSWHGFQDKESGVTSYKAAVYDVEEPSTPVVPFTDVGFSNSFTFTDLQLQHEHRYQAVVIATDAAGMDSTPAKSPAILIDTTPPVGIACNRYTLHDRQPMSYTKTGSFLFDIYSTEFQIHRPAEDELIKVIVMATDLEPGAEGHISFDDLKMPLHFKYFKSRKLLDHDSAGNILPEMAQGAIPVKISSKEYTLNATAEHVMMLPDTAEENGSLIVEVEANEGATLFAEIYRCSEMVQSDNDSVSVHQVSQFTVSVCARIRDEESQIRSLLVGIGTTPGGLQVQPLTPGGYSGHAVVEVQVQHGLPIYATVIAFNHAGFRSRFISHPVTMDRTPPVIIGVEVMPRYQNEGQANGTEVWVDVEWVATDEESGVVVCLCHLEGQNTYSAMIQETSEVSPGRCEWRLREAGHGSHVHVTVTCVNGVQIHNTRTSEWTDILLQAPSMKETTVVSLPNDALQSPYDDPEPEFQSSNSSLTFCWTGADDPTITHFHYRFLHESAPVGQWFRLEAYKTSAVLDQAAGYMSNDVITAEVRAVNARNMTSGVESTTVRVDDSSPILTGRPATATLTNRQLRLDWQGVFKVSRDVTYAVYAGTAEGYGDIINHVITKKSSFEGRSRAETLSSLFVTIQAVYSNGLSSLYQAELEL